MVFNQTLIKVSPRSGPYADFSKTREAARDCHNLLSFVRADALVSAVVLYLPLLLSVLLFMGSTKKVLQVTVNSRKGVWISLFLNWRIFLFDVQTISNADINSCSERFHEFIK